MSKDSQYLKNLASLVAFDFIYFFSILCNRGNTGNES